MHDARWIRCGYGSPVGAILGKAAAAAARAPLNLAVLRTPERIIRVPIEPDDAPAFTAAFPARPVFIVPIPIIGIDRRDQLRFAHPVASVPASATGAFAASSHVVSASRSAAT